MKTIEVMRGDNPRSLIERHCVNSNLSYNAMRRLEDFLAERINDHLST